LLPLYSAPDPSAVGGDPGKGVVADGNRKAAQINQLAKNNQVGYRFSSKNERHNCKLATVKAMPASGKFRTTVSALAGGAALGFGFEEILGVVAASRQGTSTKV